MYRRFIKNTVPSSAPWAAEPSSPLGLSGAAWACRCRGQACFRGTVQHWCCQPAFAHDLCQGKAGKPPFFEVLDYYLELIRQLHIRTYAYLGEMRASTNPLAYCEGGFYGGHLKFHEKIKPLLKTATASFGITALNELQEALQRQISG